MLLPHPILLISPPPSLPPFLPSFIPPSLPPSPCLLYCYAFTSFHSSDLSPSFFSFLSSFFNDPPPPLIFPPSLSSSLLLSFPFSFFSFLPFQTVLLPFFHLPPSPLFGVTSFHPFNLSPSFFFFLSSFFTDPSPPLILHPYLPHFFPLPFKLFFYHRLPSFSPPSPGDYSRPSEHH